MNHSKRGSFTVEATIVIPFILFVIMIILRLCVVHYQNVAISAEAMRVASRTATYWDDIGNTNPAVFQNTEKSEKWISDETFLEHDPYLSLFEFFGGGKVQKRLNNATAYAGKVMNKTPNLLGEDTKVTGVSVRRDKELLRNYILICVTRKNENPLGYLFVKLGLESEDKYLITAKGVQADITEFIRNSTFLYDILNEENFSK